MIVNRRRFLRYVGQGVFLVGSLSLTNSCAGVDRDRLSARDRKQRKIAGLSEAEMDILYLASLAPSGHNTQPWTVRIVEPQHWIVGSARERWLQAVDPQNREALLSIGAFLENLIIAAEVHGYAVDLTIIAKSPLDKEIVDIRLRKGQVREFPVEKIKMRRTVRNNFSDRAIGAEDLRYITLHAKRPHLVEVMMPHGFYFPNRSPQGKHLQEGTIEANQKQAFRDPAQQELANWIRWRGPVDTEDRLPELLPGPGESPHAVIPARHSVRTHGTNGLGSFIVASKRPQGTQVGQNNKQSNIAQAAERPHQQVIRPAGPRPIKRIEQTRQAALLILGVMC